MSETKLTSVLFLCTHNSARSIIAEALLNDLGKNRFKAYSAGSSPKEGGSPSPFALQALSDIGVSTEGLYSKSWDVFGEPNAPQMNLVITVCDNAAGEACPFWPGQPATAHWGYPDPSNTVGTDAQKLAAFRKTILQMRFRLELLTNLQVEAIDKISLQYEARSLATRNTIL